MFEDDEEELKNEDAKSESSGSSNSDKAPKYEDEIVSWIKHLFNLIEYLIKFNEN